MGDTTTLWITGKSLHCFILIPGAQVMGFGSRVRHCGDYECALYTTLYHEYVAVLIELLRELQHQLHCLCYYRSCGVYTHTHTHTHTHTYTLHCCAPCVSRTYVNVHHYHPLAPAVVVPRAAAELWELYAQTGDVSLVAQLWPKIANAITWQIAVSSSFGVSTRLYTVLDVTYAV